MLERLQDKYFGNNKSKNKIKLVKKKSEMVYNEPTKVDKLSSSNNPISFDNIFIKDNKKNNGDGNTNFSQTNSITQTPLLFNISNHIVIPIQGFKKVLTIHDRYDYALSKQSNGYCHAHVYAISDSNHNLNSNKRKQELKDNDYETIESKSNCHLSNNSHSNSIKYCLNPDRIKLKLRDRNCNSKANQNICIEQIELNNCLSESIKIKSNIEKKVDIADSSKKLLKPKDNLYFKSNELNNDREKEENKIRILNEKPIKQGKTRIKHKKPIMPHKRYKNNHNSNSNSAKKHVDPTISINDTMSMNKILKKIIEKNKKLADSKEKEWSFEMGNDSDTHVLKSNMNFHSPQSITPYSFLDQSNLSKSMIHLELKLNNIQDWNKHEEIWENISLINELSPELETYLMPPNNKDSLLSSYYKIYSMINNINSYSSFHRGTNVHCHNLTSVSIIINEYIKCPFSEIKKWKNAYQRVISRWNSDTLLEILNEIKFDNELKRIIIEKKAEVIVSNSNIVYNQIMEVLKKVQIAKCNNGL